MLKPVSTFTNTFIKRLGVLTIAAAHVGGFIALGCSIAAFFGSWSWICDLLSNGRYVYFCYLGFVIIFTLQRKHRPLLCLWLMGLLLNFYDMRALVYRESAIAASKHSLRVLQINAEKGNQAYDKVLHCIVAQNPDVIALQELQPLMAERLRENLPDYKYAHLLPDPGYGGMGVLSKYPFIEKNGLALPGGFLVVKVIVDTGIGPIAVYDVHAGVPTSQSGWTYQKVFFAKLAADCNQQTKPVIVVGDFNSTPMSVRYKDFAKGSRLIDAQNGFGWQATWMPLPNLVGKLPLSLGSILMIPIDHCLSSKELVSLSRQTGAGIDSDHLPVMTVLARRD